MYVKCHLKCLKYYTFKNCSDSSSLHKFYVKLHTTELSYFFSRIFVIYNVQKNGGIVPPKFVQPKERAANARIKTLAVLLPGGWLIDFSKKEMRIVRR